MAKHSKRARRRMQQSGLGGRLRVVHRMPRLARRLPHAPDLDPVTEFRLRCVEYARREGVAAPACPENIGHDTDTVVHLAHIRTNRTLNPCAPPHTVR